MNTSSLPSYGEDPSCSRIFVADVAVDREFDKSHGTLLMRFYICLCVAVFELNKQTETKNRKPPPPPKKKKKKNTKTNT